MPDDYPALGPAGPAKLKGGRMPFTRTCEIAPHLISDCIRVDQSRRRGGRQRAARNNLLRVDSGPTN